MTAVGVAMSMLLIRGSFKVSDRAKPDGDTVPFVPDDVAEWKLVPGNKKILPGADGHADIRLEGIDALETHYGQKPSVQHQPLKLAHQAADELLKWLGFTTVERHDDETVTTSPASVPGFILTRGTDVFGRCVAFVGRHVPPAYSGYEIGVGDELLRNTANYHLLSLGLAYPTFYAGLPAHLRDVLSAAAQTARAAKAGVWADDADVTTKGFEVTGMSSLTADGGAVILPKLFRRLKDYLELNPADPSVACFPAFLGGAADEFRIQSESSKPITGLQHVIEVTNGRTVKMTHQPEEIIFTEK
ncbi:nuclease [Streptomyces sp. NPDC008001]|uniref:nuclease n=1 Tax=Streptomyces sp. NPDC008001 TaxID=3364804 RepID=UPI0036EE9A95